MQLINSVLHLNLKLNLSNQKWFPLYCLFLNTTKLAEMIKKKIAAGN